ncbi:hypothetical protein MMC22_003169 [Lobaria immixta]|nr:hypothetical protein [Lobaria immixta]
MVGLNSTAAAAAQAHPILHVECCTKVTETSPETLADEVTKWLRANYVTVQKGQTMTVFPGVQNPENIEFISIPDITSSVETARYISLDKVDIATIVFQLHDKREDLSHSNDEGDSGGSSNHEDSEAPHAKVTLLPSRDLHGLWKSFLLHPSDIFKSPPRRVGYGIKNPPGTGKTSLCRALSQQLSIRLKKTYPTSKLIEFDAHSLLSRYFSESGKLVTKLFRKIESILNAQRNTFVIIFIDEVESLTSARQHSADSHEPRDALRAVNALLTALDRLVIHPNVVILSTSNLVKAMDPAFLDRVDIKQYVPQPSTQARYEIYRTCYLELARRSIIAPIQHFAKDDSCTQNSLLPDMFECQSPSTLEPEESAHILDERSLPDHNSLYLSHWGKESSIVWKLWKIAEGSSSLSARTLRRLPTLSLAMYTRKDPCSIDEALVALERAVQEEKLVEKSS